jgi:hypothetical protein
LLEGDGHILDNSFQLDQQILCPRQLLKLRAWEAAPAKPSDLEGNVRRRTQG